jgi:HNH endonuclease
LGKLGVGECIYCGSKTNLTDEHIIPYGLGGQDILPKSSCKTCAVETGKLEQRLLRGHWWPYRKKLGLQTRNPKSQNRLLPVRIKRIDGSILEARMPIESFVAHLIFYLDPPSILSGKIITDDPHAKSASMRMLGPGPTSAIVDGKIFLLSPLDNVEFPVKYDSADLMRFLAKVAHAHAISRLGLSGFVNLFLPEYILGRVDGLATFVGGYETPLYLPVIPGSGFHRVMLIRRDKYVSVCIQVFVDKSDPPPIYEVVVGEAAI